MTLQEAYAHLTQPLTIGGKTYPAPFKTLTIEALQQHAKTCTNSPYPALKSIAKEINTHIFNSGCDLNGTI